MRILELGRPRKTAFDHFAPTQFTPHVLVTILIGICAVPEESFDIYGACPTACRVEWMILHKIGWWNELLAQDSSRPFCGTSSLLQPIIHGALRLQLCGLHLRIQLILPC